MMEILRVTTGMFLLLGGWIALQEFVRRRSGCTNPERDMLDFMLHGCGGGCAGKSGCHSRRGEAPNETI